MSLVAFVTNIVCKVVLVLIAGKLFEWAISVSGYTIVHVNGLLLGLAALFAWAAFTLKFDVRR